MLQNDTIWQSCESHHKYSTTGHAAWLQLLIQNIFTFMKGVLAHRKTYISSLEYQDKLTKAHSDT